MGLCAAEFAVACTLLTSADDLATSSQADSATSDAPTAATNDAPANNNIEDSAVVLPPSADAGIDASYTLDGALLPGPPPPSCSVGMQQDAEAQVLTFANNTPNSVAVWWVNQSCREVFYYDLATNTDRTQNTFVTHVWRIRDPNSQAVIRDVPARPNAQPTTIPIP